MAKKKFTELPAVTTPLDGTEIIAVVQGGVSKKATIDDLPSGGGAVDSVNGQTGVVVVDLQSALDEGSTASIATELNTTVNVDDIVTTDVTNADGRVISVTDGVTQMGIEVTPAGIGLGGTGGTGVTVPTVAASDDSQKAASTAHVKDVVVGVQDLFISAAAMWPRTTNPSSDLTKAEMATSLFNIQSLDFDQTTQEFAQFQIVLPRKWNNGTVTAVVYWTATAGSGTVQWGISGGAYSNDDALTVALGTPQTADDTLIATNDLHISPATSAITLAGTPADADFLAFQISRNPASDTLNADAKLLGVSIRLTTDAAIDA